MIEQQARRIQTRMATLLTLTAFAYFVVFPLNLTGSRGEASNDAANHVMAGVIDEEAVAADPSDEEADLKFFREEVEPIFQESCQRCHGEKKQESGLRLDSREALLKGGENGAAIVPGKPEESLILKVLEYSGDIQMPPDVKLDDEKQQAIKKWIEKNAPWPKVKPNSKS